MDQTGSAQRLRDAVLALTAAAVAFLLPTLVATLDGTTGLTGALLAVAVAALLGAAHQVAAARARTTSARLTADRLRPVVLATRVTDPTHHPLRPRAPGTV